jgi:hypothetical protein
MPFTLTGRALWYVFLFAIGMGLLFIILLFGINFIYYLIGHRKFVPWAKILKFKRDDLQKTSEEVDEILKDDKKRNGRK